MEISNLSYFNTNLLVPKEIKRTNFIPLIFSSSNMSFAMKYRSIIFFQIISLHKIWRFSTLLFTSFSLQTTFPENFSEGFFSHPGVRRQQNVTRVHSRTIFLSENDTSLCWKTGLFTSRREQMAEFGMGLTKVFRKRWIVFKHLTGLHLRVHEYAILIFQKYITSKKTYYK